MPRTHAEQHRICAWAAVIIFGAAALGLMIAAAAVPEWSTVEIPDDDPDVDEIHIHLGLFKTCTEVLLTGGGEVEHCVKHSEEDDGDLFGDVFANSKVRATIAMTMLAILCAFLILCLGIADARLYAINDGHHDKAIGMMRGVIGVAILGMCASLAGLVLWTEFHKEVEHDIEEDLGISLDSLGVDVSYGVSWRLALASGIVMLLALLGAAFRITSAQTDAAQLDGYASDSYTTSNAAYETDIDSRAQAQRARYAARNEYEMRPDVQIV